MRIRRLRRRMHGTRGKSALRPGKYVWCTTVWQNARGSDKGFTENRLKMHCNDYFPGRPGDSRCFVWGDVRRFHKATRLSFLTNHFSGLPRLRDHVSSMDDAVGRWPGGSYASRVPRDGTGASTSGVDSLKKLPVIPANFFH